MSVGDMCKGRIVMMFWAILESHIWVKELKNGPSKICGEPLKTLNTSKFFKGCLPQVLLGPFFNTNTNTKLCPTQIKFSAIN